MLVCLAAGVGIALSTRGSGVEVPIWLGVLAGLGVAGFFILVESLMRGFTLRGFSTATFGLGVGLMCAWLLTRVDISGLLNLAFKSWLLGEEGVDQIQTEAMLAVLKLAFEVALFSSLAFLGAVLALRSNRDDFAFIIPYVRFRQDATTGRPIILDVDAIIDGRVPGVVGSGFLHGRLIVPRMVLDELQAMVASTSQVARHRGQRGLDSLQRLQECPDVQIATADSDVLAPGESGPQKLIDMARMLGARLLTANENLNRMARLQKVETLSMFELDEALKPTVNVGDRLRLVLVRGGKEDHQGVGYLPDGTMIVVNNGAPKIGQAVVATVISTLQTNAGTMVFAELQPAS